MTKKRGHLLPERKELLDRLVREGWSLHKMRQEHGFGYQVVRLHYPDYRTDDRKLRVPKEKLNEAAKLVDKNYTVKRISEITGLAASTILRNFPEAGADRVHLWPDRYQLLKKLVADGVSISELHKAYGFNYDTVRKYFPSHRDESSWVNEDFYQATEEQVVKVYLMAADRAPMSEIMESTGLTEKVVKSLVPKVAWSKKESGSLGGIVGGRA